MKRYLYQQGVGDLPTNVTPDIDSTDKLVVQVYVSVTKYVCRWLYMKNKNDK